MANSEFAKIVWFQRYSGYASLVPLVLYLPIGLALGVVRFFIFIHACLISYILPNGFPFKRLILRAMLAVTGLPISIQGNPAIDKQKVIIANHVTNLDPFILALLNPLILTLEGSSTKLPCMSGKLKTFEIPGDRDQSDVIHIVKNTMRESPEPFLFFPERIKTNGRNALLKFSKLPFELDCPIQPVTIQAYRYLFDVHVSTHSSTLYEDIAWCFLTPMTLFKIRYLPVTERKKDENRDEFVSRVQVNMAKSMGLTASQFSHHDVIEHIKSESVRERALPLETVPILQPKQQPVVAPPCQASVTLQAPLDGMLNTMLKQVKDVLPDIPTQTILSDLKKTRDVDATITNILDGNVDVTHQNTSPEIPLSSLSQGCSFKASSFERTAKGRQLSFQERKQAMLEAARLKYRIKHGI